MKKIAKILLFTSLLILLLEVVSASEATINDEASDTIVAEDTSTVSQKDTVTNNINTKHDEKQETPEHKTRNIQKKQITDNNVKRDSMIEVNDWLELYNVSSSISTNTSILLKEGIYTSNGTIELNNPGITLTIEGNGQSINGNQDQVFYIDNTSLVLKNITITNARKDMGGAINNDHGNLTLINSALINNTVEYDGGAINTFNGTITLINSVIANNTAEYGGGAINNIEGTLNVINSTLNSNKAGVSGGAINNEGTILINNSVLTNNMAEYDGGAIYNIEYLPVINSTLTNNTAGRNGGAIGNGRNSDITVTNTLLEYNNAGNNGGAIYLIGSDIPDVYSKCDVSTSIFTQNNASNGSAIYTLYDTVRSNITGNTFNGNTAENKETIDIKGRNIITDNNYNSTDILLNNTLRVKEDNFTTADDVVLYSTIEPANPDNYDDDIITKILKEDLIETIYINDIENVITKYENYTLSDLMPGNYSIYYSINDQTSNNVTFTVTGNSTITTPNESYEYIEGINTKIPLTITDESMKNGTINIYVKEEDEYRKLSTHYNVSDGYELSANAIVVLLENIYTKPDSSYTINVTYTNDYINPSSTKFTLKITRQINTSITINPITSTVGSIVKISANIRDQNGDNVTGGRVVFKVNGKTLRDEQGNNLYALVNDGRAMISYKVGEVWMKNTSYVEAVYSGNEIYTSSRSRADNVLDITKGNATITLDKTGITAKSGDTITLRALLLDKCGDRINSGKVVFKLNGKTLTDKEGKTLYARVIDGEAVLEYTIPAKYSAKTYKLTAVFGGGYYERTETSGTLTLKQKGVTINTDSITTKNKKTNVKATITDETGALLVTSTKLAFKVNGKTLLKNVNSTNGKIDVSFTTTLRPGMYELIIISSENGIYKTGRMTTVLKI